MISRFMIGTVLIAFSAISFAEYDAADIKSKITPIQHHFGITSWRMSDNREAWVGKSNMEGLIVSIGVKNAGLIESVPNEQAAGQALIRCLRFASAAMAPMSDDQYDAVVGAIKQAATVHTKQTIEFNGIEFDVTPKEVEGTVWLACILRPHT